MTSGVQDKLKQRCEESWDCLAKLEEIREIVELDLKDKTEALDIDMQQLDLSENSANISHKPDATRIPKGSVQPETWYTYSENNKMLAEQVAFFLSTIYLSTSIILSLFVLRDINILLIPLITLARRWRSHSVCAKQSSTRSSRRATTCGCSRTPPTSTSGRGITR